MSDGNGESNHGWLSDEAQKDIAKRNAEAERARQGMKVGEDDTIDKKYGAGTQALAQFMTDKLANYGDLAGVIRRLTESYPEQVNADLQKNPNFFDGLDKEQIMAKAAGYRKAVEDAERKVKEIMGYVSQNKRDAKAFLERRGVQEYEGYSLDQIFEIGNGAKTIDEANAALKESSELLNAIKRDPNFR